MKKDIHEVANRTNRKKFIEYITETVFCPDIYGLEKIKNCNSYRCMECWEKALKDIKFNGDK
jgi:hypothetical protein